MPRPYAIQLVTLSTSGGYPASVLDSLRFTAFLSSRVYSATTSESARAATLRPISFQALA